jgi:hypothetical protein
MPEEIDALKAALTAECTARQQAEARAFGAEAMVAHLKLLITRMKRARNTGNLPSAVGICSTSWNCSSMSWRRARPKTAMPGRSGIRAQMGAIWTVL